MQSCLGCKVTKGSFTKFSDNPHAGNKHQVQHTQCCEVGVVTVIEQGPQ